LAHITQTMNKDLPETVDTTILEILDRTMGFIDAPNNAGLDDNLFDIFEESIAGQVR
jgi:hypothetical protein